MSPIHVPHITLYSTTDNILPGRGFEIRDELFSGADELPREKREIKQDYQFGRVIKPNIIHDVRFNRATLLHEEYSYPQFSKEKLVIGDVNDNIANISIQTLNKSRPETFLNRVIDWFKGFFWKPLSLKLADGETATILVNINSAKQRLGLLGFNSAETTRILNEGTLLGDVKERILQRDVEKEFERKGYTNANPLSQTFLNMMLNGYKRNWSDEQINELLLSIESSYENGLTDEQLIIEFSKFDKKLTTEGLKRILIEEEYDRAEELTEKIVENLELLTSDEIRLTKDPETILWHVKEQHFKDNSLNLETLEKICQTIRIKRVEYAHEHRYEKGGYMCKSTEASRPPPVRENWGGWE